jgi:archaellum component FlaF (FlaF/FlaG flagellin family)
MPISVSHVTSAFNVEVIETVKWADSISENRNGIYIISTNPRLEFVQKEKSHINFNQSQVEIWQINAPNIMLNGTKVSSEDLMNQLKRFWLPDETILYIGKAEKQSLSKRIGQYYSHKVGEKGPHKGGYWLKLLNQLDELFVHVIPTSNSAQIEEAMLHFFMEHVSKESKSDLIDKKLCLPFANLQLRAGVIKNHGLKNHYQ